MFLLKHHPVAEKLSKQYERPWLGCVGATQIVDLLASKLHSPYQLLLAFIVAG